MLGCCAKKKKLHVMCFFFRSHFGRITKQLMFGFEPESMVLMRTEPEEVHAEVGGSNLFYSPLVAAEAERRGLWYVPQELPTSEYRGDYSATSVRAYYGGTGADAANALSMPKQPRPVRTLLDVAIEQRAHLALAFAMGTHPRLGSADETAVAGADTTNCAYASMPAELVQRVVEACVLWQEGQTGELEGVVRLLGGGMTKARVST